MSEADETDTSFADVFKSKFAVNTPSTKAALDARLKAERRAGRTPKERNRAGKGPLRNVQMNFRGTARTKQLVELLAERLGGSHADIFELAIEQMAKANKLGAA
jgi:hypothetical protein